MDRPTRLLFPYSSSERDPFSPKPLAEGFLFSRPLDHAGPPPLIREQGPFFLSANKLSFSSCGTIFRPRAGQRPPTFSAKDERSLSEIVDKAFLSYALNVPCRPPFVSMRFEIPSVLGTLVLSGPIPRPDRHGSSGTLVVLRIFLYFF